MAPSPNLGEGALWQRGAHTERFCLTLSGFLYSFVPLLICGIVLGSAYAKLTEGQVKAG